MVLGSSSAPCFRAGSSQLVAPEIEKQAGVSYVNADQIFYAAVHLRLSFKLTRHMR